MSFKKTILNLILPIECLGCKKEDVWLCQDCLAKLKFSQNYYITKNAFENISGVFVVFDYNNKQVKKILKTYKYRFAKDLGEIISQKICIFLKKMEKEEEISLKNTLIIPVPLHKKRANWRGFNQAEVIARAIALKFNLKFEENLVRIKNNQPQAELDREKRMNNVANSFSWQGDSLSKQKILLIDDVSTTGSTMDECAKTLKQSGAKKIQGLVIAHG